MRDGRCVTCFGNTVDKTTTNNSTYTPPAWLTTAGQANTGFATNLENTGFTPYSGNQVAGFSPQQQASFGLGNQIAGGVSPYVGQTGSLISNYANAGAQSVTPQTISSAMSPYMSQYVAQSLTPQLQMQDQQFAAQNKAVDSAATGAGAFGDTGWGQLRGTTTQAQDAARSGLVGQAYNSAFNTAIGAGAQDVANNLSGQTTNANLAETALGRQLTGAQALYGQGTGATNLQNTLGGQQTAQTQAQLNAAYNQYLMAQQYPFQTLSATDQALNAAKGTGPTTTNGTSTTSAPDNSGWGILGSLGGAILGGPAGGAIGGALGSTIGGAFTPNGGGNPMAYMPGGSAYGASPSYQNGGMYPMFADGGRVKAGKPVIVGERGPELFIPGKKGTIIPNEVLAAAREKRAQKTGSADGLSRQLGAAA